MEALTELKKKVAKFEVDHAGSAAAAEVEIPTMPVEVPGTRTKGTGIMVQWRPAKPQREAPGLWVAGPNVGNVRLMEAPAELLIRASRLLPELRKMIQERDRKLCDMAAATVDYLSAEGL